MNQFFLLNETIQTNNFEYFKEGMSSLVAIEKEKNDVFMKHDSIWNLEIISTLYSNYGGLTEKAIGYFIETLKTESVYMKDENTFDSNYSNVLNAFLGIDFSKTSIQTKKRVTDNITYKNLLHDDLWNVTFRNLWSKKEKLFPDLILCGDVENQITMIGGASHFNQIIERLKEFNRAISEWKSGDFSYRQVNQNYALQISPESNQTMSSYGYQRVFSMPSGGTQTFELHIKTGDLRFHFYPDNQTKKVYIGYIGPHLSTVSN